MKVLSSAIHMANFHLIQVLLQVSSSQQTILIALFQAANALLSGFFLFLTFLITLPLHSGYVSVILLANNDIDFVEFNNKMRQKEP